ncbi:predicted hydrolase [Longilinea arvoryzae]|uniref:Predicted hydrolase n=1 Tax=Longilinea arvoryzae TaxID=360412 RepID=A0A0S7BL57_9CHLR|nr:HAD hydrolase-like protein [Longilinea arvoryzae]GAP15363.1 predicted hydrolase [Longilinea arvoryzae]
MDTNTKSSTIIAFDWGDTLMLDLPQYNGPMVDWPEVIAVEGAQSTLSELSQHNQLIVATNAAASNPEKVRAALQRVGLAEFIGDIFTSHIVNGKKPQREFFRSIERKYNPEAEFIMVGDSYSSDIVGAWQAGWLAVWYNPSDDAAPGLMPLHDLEIRHLDALPAALAQPRLPGWTQAISWLTEQKAPASLQLHIQAVSAAAYQMAVWMHAAGEPVNPLLAQRGAMLHDLAKVSSLHDKHTNHGEAAAHILIERGQPALAEIARRHLLTNLLNPALAPRTWEEKIVFMADKLMEGSHLVTLDQRINALSRRYSRFSAGIQACQAPLRNLQKELCAHMHIPESQLTDRLQDAFLGHA